MKIAIGSDHAGFEYKGRIIGMLTAAGHEVRDFGTYSSAPVDYPLFHRARGAGGGQRGMRAWDRARRLGNGEQITANKVRGIRCALGFSLDTARWAKMHNDANVSRLASAPFRGTGAGNRADLVEHGVEGGRHVARLNGIAAVENSQSQGQAGTFPVYERTMLIRPEYLNQRGTLYGGYMLEWADDLAYNAASLTFPRRPSSPVAWRRLISPHRCTMATSCASTARRARGHEFLHRGGVVYRCP